MSKFKETIAADISRTFINPGEFAEDSESYLVNGEPMDIIIDGTELMERSKQFKIQGAERVYVKELLVYVSATAYGPEPKIGSVLTLQKVDGKLKTYAVTNCQNEDGVYVIALEVYRS